MSPLHTSLNFNDDRQQAKCRVAYCLLQTAYFEKGTRHWYYLARFKSLIIRFLFSNLVPANCKGWGSTSCPKSIQNPYLGTSFPCCLCAGIGVTRNLRSRETKTQYTHKENGSRSMTQQIPGPLHSSLYEAGRNDDKEVFSFLMRVLNGFPFC